MEYTDIVLRELNKRLASAKALPKGKGRDAQIKSIEMQIERHLNSVKRTYDLLQQA